MNKPQIPSNNPAGMGTFSQTPAPSGENVSKKGKINPQDLISYGTGDESVTSTFTIERLFSVKQRKFLKPYRVEVYGLEYHILPGRYILIYSHVHKRKDEVMKWSIKLLKIYKAEDGSIKEEVEKESEWITPISESERTVAVLKDIENPGFHGHSKVNYDKVYSDEEVQQLLEGGVDPALGENLE